jgi:hypothetical protein
MELSPAKRREAIANLANRYGVGQRTIYAAVERAKSSVIQPNTESSKDSLS